MVPQDMRFPDTLSDDDIARTIAVSRALVRRFDEVGGNEANAWPDGDESFLARFNPASELPLRLRFADMSAEARDVAATGIEFTGLSWLDWGDFRMPPAEAEADPAFAERARTAACLRLHGWLDALMSTPDWHQQGDNWGFSLQILYIPHLARAQVSIPSQGRRWVIPMAPEAAEYMAAILIGGPYLEAMPNRETLMWRDQADGWLDWSVGSLVVALPRPDEFEAWAERYQAQAWKRVHLE